MLSLKAVKEHFLVCDEEALQRRTTRAVQLEEKVYTSARSLVIFFLLGEKYAPT